jgi:hypothetical protein
MRSSMLLPVFIETPALRSAEPIHRVLPRALSYREKTIPRSSRRMTTHHIPTQTASQALAPNSRLPPYCLKLAVVDCILANQSSDQTCDRLWREQPATVERLHRKISEDRLDLSDGASRHGLHHDRVRRLHRPLPQRQRRGMTVSQMADAAVVSQATMAALLEHHGYLELVPYGRDQRRRLVTDQAFKAGLGHNVDAAQSRIGKLEGMAKAAVFPVFYPECVPNILWTLNIDGIKAMVKALPSKRSRLSYLLRRHGYLPDTEIAALAGCTPEGVRKRRLRS